MHEVELHAGVAEWLDGLADSHFAKVDALVGRVAEEPKNPSAAPVRYIEREVWELKFRLMGDAWRLTYWVDGKRVIFLTVIRKTQDHQQLDIERCLREQVHCAAHHQPATDDYRRD